MSGSVRERVRVISLLSQGVQGGPHFHEDSRIGILTKVRIYKVQK